MKTSQVFKIGLQILTVIFSAEMCYKSCISSNVLNLKIRITPHCSGLLTPPLNLTLAQAEDANDAENAKKKKPELTRHSSGRLTQPLNSALAQA